MVAAGDAERIVLNAAQSLAARWYRKPVLGAKAVYGRPSICGSDEKRLSFHDGFSQSALFRYYESRRGGMRPRKALPGR